MKQLSDITPTGTKPWLQSVYERQRERSFLLGKQAIDILLKEGAPITYKSIHEKTKEIDPEGKGVHHNTIKTNEALHSYYKQYSKTFKKSQTKRKHSLDIQIDESTMRRVSLDRNLSNIRKKYLRLSKEELVSRIIQLEQYVATHQKKWVANHFEKFQ